MANTAEEGNLLWEEDRIPSAFMGASFLILVIAFFASNINSILSSPLLTLIILIIFSPYFIITLTLLLSRPVKITEFGISTGKKYFLAEKLDLIKLFFGTLRWALNKEVFLNWSQINDVKVAKFNIALGIFFPTQGNYLIIKTKDNMTFFISYGQPSIKYKENKLQDILAQNKLSH